VLRGIFYFCDFDEKRNKLRIFLKNGEKTIIAYSKNYKPYFYILNKKTSIKNIEKILNEKKYKEIFNYEKDYKIIDGEKIEVLKIFTNKIEDRRKIAKEIGLETTYDKMPAWQQFILDNNITPLSIVEIDSIEFSNIKEIEIPQEIKLKTLYFTTIIYSKHGYPKIGEDQILVIACLTDSGEKIFINQKNDKKVIEDFFNFIKEYDPDIIIGYGQDVNDWPYIIARAKKNGIKIDISKDGSEIIETGKYFRGMILKETYIAGRINFDLFSIAWRDFPHLATKSLFEVAEELGIKDLEEMPEYKIGEFWKNENGKNKIIEYAIKKVKLIKKVSDELLPFQFELAKLVKVMPNNVIRITMGEIVDNLILEKAWEKNILLPERPDKTMKREAEEYIGGYVWLKSPGVYENMVYLDVASMYPSIINEYNISFETINCKCCKPNESLLKLNDVKAYVCKKKKGLISEIVLELINERRKIKEEMEKYKKDSSRYKSLYAKQYVLKKCANSIYGYLGWIGSRVYNKEAAELITKIGRHFINEIRKIIEKEGFKVVYIDTDGIQFTNGTTKKCYELIEKINEKLPIKIELQYIANRAIYLAKKKYAHLINGRIESKGFEYIRKDYPKIIRDAQKQLIEIILKTKDFEKALKAIQKYRNKLISKNITKEDLVIIEQLTKKIEEYERVTKGVSAGKFLEEKEGIEIHRGQNIKILIIKGKEAINYRARPVEFFELEDCDIEYYLNLFDQVIERTFESLGKKISLKQTTLPFS
jgi:DNA polymerase I